MERHKDKQMHTTCYCMGTLCLLLKHCTTKGEEKQGEAEEEREREGGRERERKQKDKKGATKALIS